MGATGCRRCQGAAWPCQWLRRSSPSCGCPRRYPVDWSRSRLAETPPFLSPAMGRWGLSPTCHIPPAGPRPLQGSPPTDACPEAAG